jgi:hypothetical protein
MTFMPRLGNSDRLAKHQLGQYLLGSRAEGLPLLRRVYLR